MSEAGPRGGAPGWYQDPDDPTRLRYWAGRAWTGRRRCRPNWEVASAEWVPPPLDEHAGERSEGPVLEGPVRAAELPAIAAAVIGPRDVVRPAQTTPPTPRRGHHQVVGPRPPGRGVSPVRRPYPWLGSRRPMAMFGLVAALALIAMVVSVGLTRPPGYSQWLLTDHNFINRANALCSATLPGLRRPTQAAMTTPGTSPAPTTQQSAAGSAAAAGVASSSAPATPSLSPTQIHAEAAGVNALAQRLAALPLAARDQSHVYTWLTSWHAWAGDEDSYASYLSSHPRSSATAGAASSGKGAQLASLAQVEADAADQFAVSNGLLACTLTPGAQPSN